MNELTLFDNMQIDQPNKYGQVSTIGWQPPEDVTESVIDDFIDGWVELDAKALPWNIGDAINLKADKWDRVRTKLYAEIGERLDKKSQTIRAWAYVCDKVKFVSRLTNLSWMHHYAVAPLDPDEQRYWLQEADDNDWSVLDLEEAIAASAGVIEISDEQSTLFTLDQLVHGDARDMIEQMPDGVRLLLTDPPYGKDFQSNRRIVKDKADKIQGDGNLNDAVDTFDTVLSQAYDKLADDAFVCVWCNWENYPAFRSVIEANGCIVRTVIVWDKPNHGTGDLEGAPAPKHEWIIFAAKGNPKLTGDRFDNLQPGNEFLESEHPTLKPMDLARLIIENVTNMGDIVADPFMGAGSSLVPAAQLGRNVWGCEIISKWHSEATRTLHDFLKGERHE